MPFRSRDYNLAKRLRKLPRKISPETFLQHQVNRTGNIYLYFRLSSLFLRTFFAGLAYESLMTLTL